MSCRGDGSWNHSPTSSLEKNCLRPSTGPVSSSFPSLQLRRKMIKSLLFTADGLVLNIIILTFSHTFTHTAGVGIINSAWHWHLEPATCRNKALCTSLSLILLNLSPASHAALPSSWYSSRYLASFPARCSVSGGAPMARVLCPRSSSVPLPYGHPDVTICLNHPFCSCLNILIDLLSYVKDL